MIALEHRVLYISASMFAVLILSVATDCALGCYVPTSEDTVNGLSDLLLHNQLATCSHNSRLYQLVQLESLVVYTD